MARWFVDLLVTTAAGQELAGRVYWDEDAGLRFEGVSPETFKDGIIGNSKGGLLFLSDGRKFFEALPLEYKGSYFRATTPKRDRTTGTRKATHRSPSKDHP